MKEQWDIPECWERKTMQVTNVYAICAFAAIGGALFGFDISSMSGVLGTQAYIRYFDNPQS